MDNEDFHLGAIFLEPPCPPIPSYTMSEYTRKGGSSNKVVKVRLVGSHPLWGHLLWNAARCFASYLEVHPDYYRGKTVLELGAGGGLPGIVAAMNGASKVVLTDYPDRELIENLEFNVANNNLSQFASRVTVQGFIWGQSPRLLLNVLSCSATKSQGFDLIILSDLIFNHSQHDALLNTCSLTLASLTSRQSDAEVALPSILVFYTHHRPHLAHRDMQFFAKALSLGWTCELVVMDTFPPMFPEDPGPEDVRSTVYGWRLRRMQG